MALLEVNNLKTYFYTRAGIVKAVDGIDFSLERGQTLGIVGESGSGKSVAVSSVMGLIPKPPGKVVAGSAMFAGQDLLKLSEREMQHIRGRRIAMIFQDPMTSLNPYLRISSQLTEAVEVHERAVTHREAMRRAIEALEQVGIPAASERIRLYPHEFSGGMRQRVMIAMALITKPDVIIADEPTTALDVTVQAQILELLKELQAKFGTGVIMITHDLGVVAGVSDEVIVMYAGRAVEHGSTNDIFYRHAHPCTFGLLKSIPRVHSKDERLFSIPGNPPDPSRLKPGCAFAPRCHKVMPVCRENQPVPRRKIVPIQTRSAGSNAEMRQPNTRIVHESMYHLEEAL